MAAGFNMQERKEPDFVKFAEGEVVEGILINVERIEVGEQKKKATRYTLQDLENGELRSFLGAYQIDVKLRPSDKGHFVQVRYEGEDKSITRNGNAMKRFKVLVSDKPAARAAAEAGVSIEESVFITDSDIPF